MPLAFAAMVRVWIRGQWGTMKAERPLCRGPLWGAGRGPAPMPEKKKRRNTMSDDLIRAQRPDREVHYDKVSVPACQKKPVSRLRETEHAPYRCTRSYRTNGGQQ